MKLHLIEKPKNEIQGAKCGLLSILTEGDMGSIFGGLTVSSCGVHISCGKRGKNSCAPFSSDCSSVVTCTIMKSWVAEPVPIDITPIWF